MEVSEQGALEQFAVDAVGELTRVAGRIERVGGAIQGGAVFANEVFPGGIIAGGTAAREREVLEVQRAKIRTAFRASLERFSKALERHTPPLGVCPAIELLDELRVDTGNRHTAYRVRW